MRKIVIGLLALLLLIGACGSSTDDSGGDEAGTFDRAALDEAAAPASAEDVVAAPAEEAADGASLAGQVGSPLLEQRKIIQTADLQIEAEDPEAAYLQIRQIVERSGGFVAEASVFTPIGQESRAEVFVTLRVPARSMNDTLAAIEAIGETIRSSIGSQDVTEEYADVEAQIRNLQVLEEELVALLTEVRQRSNSDPDELLRVFDRISQVRGQIESLQGRRQLLDDLVDLATITVTIVPPPDEPPIVDEDGWNAGAVARRALRATVSTLQGIGSFLIWVALYLLPVVAVFGLPALLVFWFVRRTLRARRTRIEAGEAKPPAPGVPPAQPDPAPKPNQASAAPEPGPGAETPPELPESND